MSQNTNRTIVRNLPVAKFYYQGKHSHPVRRTVLVIDSSSKYITGYELREGATTRDFMDAPIKTFKKTRIATIGKCGQRMRARTPSANHSTTTLNRVSLLDLVQVGP